MAVVVDLKTNEHIKFSRSSGYYDSEFDLKIIGGAGKNIYYTLDGSLPTTEDHLYDKKTPIKISDATNHENVYSAREDTSTAFRKELVAQYSMGDPNYVVPEYKVDKCNIIRAAVFDEGGNCLDSIVGTYFVGFQEKCGYEKIYTASVVTDPDNLFDYRNGIYVTGAAFDEFLDDLLNNQEGTYPYWWFWDANYRKGGMDWEKEAFVTIFNEKQQEILSEKCGIRIQGYGSRGSLPKSIGCYARKQYSGSNEFQVDLFHENMFSHKFVFFSGGSDNLFKVKDNLAHYMEKGLNIATMDFIPCAVFLDGEYWGLYYITENYNADFISDHYRVNKDNIIMFKNGGLTEGMEEDDALYWEMYEFICNHDMSREENYRKASNLIDMDSFIDYYAAQIYIARSGDWPGGNIALWRVREEEGTFYGDGKWRWMLFDVNSGGMSIDLTESDTLEYVLEKDPMFHALYCNENFRLQFAKRIMYIGKEVFATERCAAFLDEFKEEMREPFMAGSMRFYMNSYEEDFDINIECIKLFFQGRYNAVWDFLVKNMGEMWLSQNGLQK